MSEIRDKPSPTNRLSIGFLMLWTLGTAIILALHRVAFPENSSDSWNMRAFQTITSLGFSLGQGIQVGSLFLLAYRLATGRGGFPTAPGHWLLLVRGTVALLLWSSYVIVYLATNSSGPGNSHLALVQIVQAPVYLVGVVLFVAAALRTKDAGGLWTAILFVMTAIYVLSASMRGISVSVLIAIVISILLPLAAASDPRRRERDFYHWAGVATTMGLNLLFLAGWVVQSRLE